MYTGSINFFSFQQYQYFRTPRYRKVTNLVTSDDLSNWPYKVNCSFQRHSHVVTNLTTLLNVLLLTLQISHPCYNASGTTTLLFSVFHYPGTLSILSNDSMETCDHLVFTCFLSSLKSSY
jgi:hypothetical protein